MKHLLYVFLIVTSADHRKVGINFDHVTSFGKINGYTTLYFVSGESFKIIETVDQVMLRLKGASK